MKILIILFLMFIQPFVLYAKVDMDVHVAQSMAKRLIPQYADQIHFKKIQCKQDIFRIESAKDAKVVISGNNANSMAMGLNYYLKYYCLTTVSWYADIPIEMPDMLPVVEEPVEVKAKVEDRFFLNYCTFGYSMAFWTWDDWEHFIDWMALNGINMPLAITGQEAVWLKVWKKLGISEDEILSYFTGPTYLPWHRMANIDSWNGPLPMEWLDKQVILQKKILARERELNMKPVLPAFNGHVPAALKKLYPKADIQSLGKWAGFSTQYHCSFLHPGDSLFSLVQKEFLTEQKKLFGTDHIYGVDPFNEGDPPSWNPDYLKKVSELMFHSLTQVDPEAKWLQMAWMFYFDRKKWTQPCIQAYMDGTPQGRMLMLDYHCENTELWKSTSSFYGQPFIWCYLGNFGGNTAMIGNVRESGRRLEELLSAGTAQIRGIGSTLEGLDVVQFPYEYIFDKAWGINYDDDIWLEALAASHTGSDNIQVQEAWKILFNEIYVQVPGTAGVLLNYRPSMGKNSGRTVIKYSNKRLLEVWRKLLTVSEIKRDAFKIDLISVGRQVLGNYFLEVKNEFDNMYLSKDLLGLKSRAAIMRELLHDIDRLTSYHAHTSLSDWIRKAREYSDVQDVKDYYERNARNLIATWGGTLNDYASRTWSGLIRDYYACRWEVYFQTVFGAVEEGRDIEQSELDKALNAVEQEWVSSTRLSEGLVDGSLLDFSKYLLTKYESKL